MLPWAQRTGHLVMAYSPLAQGFLSGRYTEQQQADRRGAGGQRDVPAGEPARRRAAARACCARWPPAHDATPAQIALAWLVHFPNVVAIPGASSVAQVEQQRGRRGHPAEPPTSTAR